MTNAEGDALCSRCGEPLAASAERCPVCAGVIPRAVLPIVAIGPLDSGARPASPVRRALSLGTSVGVSLIAGAAVVAASLSRGIAAALLLGTVVALVIAVVQLVVWLRTGRALGNVLTGTRSVRADDGTAPSWRMLRTPPAAALTAAGAQGTAGRLLGVVTVVVADGRDPLALAARGVASLPPRVPGTVARNALARAVVLTFDGRLRIPLVRSVVLGRNPPPVGGETVVVALPDMSRSISKSHVRLDHEGGRVFAQDLGSTNGTELVTAEGTRELRSGERVEVPVGAHLLLAGMPLRLDSGHQSVAA